MQTKKHPKLSFRGTRRPQVFPLTAHSEADIVLPTLTTRYAGAQANGGYIGTESPKIGTLRTHKDGNGFREVKSGLAPTIPARAREDGSGQPVIISQNQRRELRVREEVGSLQASTSASQFDAVSDEISVRRLTPLECERLQAFPDGWTEKGMSTTPDRAWVEISDTQRYKMCGNAVTTNVVEAVFRRIVASMDTVGGAA